MRMVNVFLIFIVFGHIANAQHTKLWQEAEQLKKAKQYDKAAVQYQAFAEQELKLADPVWRNVALGLFWSADCYHKTAQKEKALKNLDRLIGFAERKKIRKAEVSALNSKGLILKELGQYDKALKSFHRSCSKADEYGIGSATILSNIGHIHIYRSEYEKAQKIFQESKPKCQTDRERMLYFGNMGALYYWKTDYDKVLSHFNQALALASNTQDKIDALNNIIATHNAGGGFDKAQQLLRQVNQINQKSPGFESPAILNHRAGLALRKGEFGKAIEYYRKAKELDEKAGRVNDLSAYENNIGLVYYNWNKLDLAKKSFENALKLDKKYSNRANQAKAINNIAIVLIAQGQYPKAQRKIKLAKKINEQLGRKGEIADNIGTLGHIAYLKKDYAQAISHFQKALNMEKKLKRRQRIAHYQNSLGGLYIERLEFAKATELLQKSREINSSGVPALNGLSVNLSNLGCVYFYTKQYKKACNILLESIELKEKLRRTAPFDIRRNYFENQIATYRYLIATYLKQNNIKEACRIIELSRSKVLAERLSLSNKVDIPFIDEIQSKLSRQAAIIIYAQTIDNHLAEIVITKHYLNFRYIDIISLLSRLGEKSNEDNRKRKNSPSIQQNGTHWPMDLIGQNNGNFALNNILFQYNLALQEKNDKYKPISRKLYSILISPIQKYIKDKKQLIIIPDGVMGVIPFETLIDSSGKFLIQKQQVRYIHSLSVQKLLQKRKYKKRSKKILAFAIDDYSRTSIPRNYKQYVGGFDDLEYAIDEAKNITKSKQDKLFAKKVYEKRIKLLSSRGVLAKYRIIHFAVHAIAISTSPHLSALILLPGKGDDGFLNVNEIMKLELKADFVNLSACQTGLGKIYQGEGIVGICQAFFIAGANSMSISLWNIDDLATKKFMKEYYAILTQ